MGSAPTRSPSLENYPAADMEVKQLAGSLWGAVDKTAKYAQIGKGMLIDGLNMEEALALINCVPDFVVGNSDQVLYGHRTLGDGREVYFITNQGEDAITFNPEFRVLGTQPELWDPVNGTIRKLPSYSDTQTGTIIPMKLAVNESAFIVFRDKSKGGRKLDIAANFPELTKVEELKDWTLTFNKEQRGISEHLKMIDLEDLSQNKVFDVQHYSGTVWYKTSVELSEKLKGRTFLTLTDVSVMAKVYINDQYAGGLWTKPYRLDITDYLKKGENAVKIEVVTTWVNRLIGDQKLPEEERKVWLTTNPWKSTDDLHKAGIVGAVLIENGRFE